jgi:hypothetical protein
VSGEERTCARSEDAAAFALQALEPDDEATMREHLATCPSCRATVADAEVVAAALAGAVDQVEPPARLRENILAEAARTAQAPRAGAPAPGAAGAAGTAAAHRRRAGQDRAGARAAGPGRSRTGPDGPGRGGAGTSGPGRRRLVAAVLALVAVVGVAGLGAYTVRLQQQRDAQVAQTQALVDVLTQLDRPGTSHATLSTSDGRPVAAVVTTPAERMVMAAGLPPNDPSTHVYVVWGVSTAEPRPIGTFDVDPAGPGPVVHQLGPVDGPQPYLGYAISLEPGRAAPATPTTVVASGQVQT